MKIRDLTGTSLLLAITLLSQSLRLWVPLPMMTSMFIIGSLVGTCMILATWKYGLWAGIAIAIVAPVVAFLQGMLKLIPLLPVVALGSILFCVTVYYMRHMPVLVTAIVAALVKMIVLYLGTCLILSLFHIPDAMQPLILFPMSWPQMVTGMIAVVLATCIERRIHI